MENKLRSFVKENTWLTRHSIMDFGWGNGYVVLPVGHKYHGVDYDNIPCEVHYGLTFSDLITEDFIENWPELTKEDLGGWLVGFDTAHHNDTLEKWPKERVQEEADQLLKQLSE